MSSNVLNTEEQEAYWEERYASGQTGWDLGLPSDPIREYLDQLENKDLAILIPGAGNAYEAEYAWEQGFKNVTVLDIAAQPLRALGERLKGFPESHLIKDNFFTHEGRYDLILEQTFFCSFPPESEFRRLYFKRAHYLLRKGGKLAGLWFGTERVGRPGQRPFGGTKEEYLPYLEPYFRVKTLEVATNSIPPRAGNELFGILERRPHE